MIRFSHHARIVMEKRGLPQAWIESALLTPDWTEPDPVDPAVVRSFKKIEEAGGRVLRVAHRVDANDILVITAFLDRGARA